MSSCEFYFCESYIFEVQKVLKEYAFSQITNEYMYDLVQERTSEKQDSNRQLYGCTSTRTRDVDLWSVRHCGTHRGEQRSSLRMDQEWTWTQRDHAHVGLVLRA